VTAGLATFRRARRRQGKSAGAGVVTKIVE
jgi:hypothetical protein